MRKKALFLLVVVLALQSCAGQGDVVGKTTLPTDLPVVSETVAVDSAAPTSAPAIPTLLPSPTVTMPPLPTATATPEALAQSVSGVEIRRPSNIGLSQNLGVYWVRRNALLWSAVEAVQGFRDWSAVTDLEQELIQLSQAGLEVILVVRGTPEWAQAFPGVGCGPVRVENRDALASFMQEAVQRYSAAPYNVHFWELWNEPDIDPALISPTSPFGCWGDLADQYYGGGDYTEVLKVVYPLIKVADPQAQLLVGGLLLDCDPRLPPETSPGSGQYKDCTPSRFLEGVLVNGGGDYFDGVSFHAYDFYNGTPGQFSNGSWHSSWDSTGPVLLEKAEYLRELLTTYGCPDKFLMNTEVALLCGRDGTEEICQGDDFSNTKAYYAVQAYTAAQSIGIWTNIWYSMEGWRGSALVDPSGEPLPVYQAIRNYSERLDQLAPWGEVSDFDGLRVYEFRGGNGDASTRVWVAWSLDGLPHEVSLVALPSAVYDAFGNALPLSHQFTVTVAPVYIEWPE